MAAVAAEPPSPAKHGGSQAGVTPSGLAIAKSLDSAASPGLVWLQKERLRACCFALGTGPMPEFAVRALTTGANSTAPSRLELHGETILRIQVPAGDTLRFRLQAHPSASPFPDATYALFDPEGRHLGDGIVKQGTSSQVATPVAKEGYCLAWINSGPASGNSFSLEVGNRVWVIDGRGKSAYLGTPVAVNSIRDLSLAGFNTVLLGTWNWGDHFATEEGLRRWLDKIKPWAEAAARYQIRLIPYIGWACGKSEADAAEPYRKTLSLREIDGPRPCPLAEEYWQRVFVRRALALAELAKQNPAIAGIGLDPESYYFYSWYEAQYKRRSLKPPAWDSTVFFNNDECFCDHCFSGFLKAQGRPTPAVEGHGKARWQWLKDQGLLKAYYAHLEEQLQQLTSKLRDEVHAVQPDFLFTVMLLSCADLWWCRGASRGLGSERVPVLDYDEGTYTAGFTSRVDRLRERAAGLGAHVVHGGTLWAGRHSPQDPHLLSAQMYHFAIRDGGYWFWAANGALWKNPDQLRHYYSLAGTQAEYWNAFVLANREILRKLEQGDSYASKLDRLTPPPPTPNLDREKGPNAWGKKPFYPLQVKSGTQVAFYVPPTAARFTFLWGLQGKGGLWTATFTSPRRTIRVQQSFAQESEAQIPLDIQADERGAAWQVRLECDGADAALLGIQLRDLPPYLSGSPATLLAPESKPSTK